MNQPSLQDEGGEHSMSQSDVDPKAPLLATIDPENNIIDQIDLSEIMNTNRKDLTMHIKEDNPVGDEFGFDEMYGNKRKSPTKLNSGQGSGQESVNESVDISDEESKKEAEERLDDNFQFQKITNMEGSGMRSSLKKSLTIKAEKRDFSKDKPIGTELVIEKMLMYEAGNDEDLDDWNMLDSDLDSDQPEHISYKKMMNEMLQREARHIDDKGHNVLYQVCGSKVGRHSSSRKNRVSELEDLGPGIVLYFKMLKYFQCCFFMFTLISIPILMLCISGHAYVNEPMVVSRWLSSLSLGGIDEKHNIECAYQELDDTNNKFPMNFQCHSLTDLHINGNDGYKMKKLLKVGLAKEAHTCMGMGMGTHVDTVQQCTFNGVDESDEKFQISNHVDVFYNIDDATTEAIQKEFDSKCLEQMNCEFELDLETMFDDTCNDEIDRRLLGKTSYGPAKVYALFECEADLLKLTVASQGDMTREQGSVLIVVLDLIIVFLFCCAVIRLRWYEDLYDRDRQLQRPMIEDFSIYIPEIPFKTEEFNDNPDLLTAMLAVSLEEILIKKFMDEDGLDELEAQDLSQVSSIHYGMNKHHSLTYLVQISEASQKIGNLRKKTMFNTKGTHGYERTTWDLYTEVTRQKKEYYKIRQENWDPIILNAYVTFRDIQARNKAVELFNRNPVRKFLAKTSKCLSKLYPDDYKISEHKACLSAQAAVDPETIVWENLGTPAPIKRKRAWDATTFTISVFLTSFIGIAAIALYEKEHRNWHKGECNGESFYGIDQATDDYRLDWPHQQGLMQCYCAQEYRLYGQPALKLLFEDGERHCQRWYLIFGLQDYTNLLLSLYIAVVNYILQEVYDDLGKRRNTKNVSDNYILRTLTIFLCQYINTALLYTFAYHSFGADDRVRVQNRMQDVLVGPFDEFDRRWYMVIGASVTLISIFISVQPHIGLLFKAIGLNLRRCADRGCTQNKRKTKQVTQAEYEDLYTGPEFILQIRYSQILAQIFITMSFSSGLPILYLITFVSLVISFWVDKYLMLRFFRKQNQFTGDLSRSFVNLLPWAVVPHVLYGFFIYSHPRILESPVVTSFGGSSKYFHTERVDQKHVVIFMAGAMFLLVLMLLEDNLMSIVAFLRKKFTQCGHTLLKQELKPDENDEMIDAPDLYYELNFEQLCKEFKLAKVEKQKYQMLKAKAPKDSTLTPEQVSNYIDPYIQICERNEKDIKDRMNELVDKYVVRVDKAKLQGIKTQDQKTLAVRKLYEDATDLDNPNRAKLNVEQDLHGRISNNVCSYDLMDNPKYEKIEECLEVLNERLGETEQAHQLMKMKTFASNSQSAYLSMQRKMSSVNRLVAINAAARSQESLDTQQAREEKKGVQLADLEKIASLSGTEGPEGDDYVEMTVQLDTTMKLYEQGGGDEKFIKTIMEALKLDKSLMKVINKRSGSVFVTFRVKSDGSLSLEDLERQLQNLLQQDIGYPIVGVSPGTPRQATASERAGTPEQRSASALGQEVGKSSEFEKLTRKVTEGGPDVMLTDGRDESCDKTQLLEDQGDHSPGNTKSIHNIFTPGSVKSPKSQKKSLKSKSKSPQSPTRSKSPRAKSITRSKSPKSKSPASPKRTPIGKALKEALPKLKEEMLRTEGSPDRGRAYKSVVRKQNDFQKQEEEAISATQKKIIAEQMARVSQMKMTGSSIMGGNTARGVQPREMFHPAGAQKRSFNFKTIKPRGPQMRQTQNEFGQGVSFEDEDALVPAKTREAALQQMQGERIRQTIKQIQKMQNQQKAQKMWNDRSQQDLLEQENSLASLSSASVYGKMPKQIMTMAKQNQMLQSAMVQHLRLSKQVQNRNEGLAAHDSARALNNQSSDYQPSQRTIRNKSKDSNQSGKSNKNSQFRARKSSSKSPSQKNKKNDKELQDDVKLEMSSVDRNQSIEN